MYQNASQFSSDSYPPPPPGWSGFNNSSRDMEQCYAPEWNGSMGGGAPKITPNHSIEFNGPLSQSIYNTYEQYNSNFSSMPPNAMNSSYGSNSHGQNNPMYLEDENRARRKSSMMYHQIHKNSQSQDQHEGGFNRNYPSHLESMSTCPSIQEQYRREHGGSRQAFTSSPPSEICGQYRNREQCGPGHAQSFSPPSQSEQFQYPSRRSSLPSRTLQGHPDSSFYQSNRYENYLHSRGEEWNSGGRLPQRGPMPNSNPSLMLTR